jgi:hypothetical protein
VALAATVHVGDPSYYRGLQEECESNYDVVLFELITAEENLRAGRTPQRRRRAVDDDGGCSDVCGFDASPPEGRGERMNTSTKHVNQPVDVAAIASFQGDNASSDADTGDRGGGVDGSDGRSDAEENFLPTLAVHLSPTQDARELAEVHGLCAQLDALDLRREGWFVADMSKAGGERGSPCTQPHSY